MPSWAESTQRTQWSIFVLSHQILGPCAIQHWEHLAYLSSFCKYRISVCGMLVYFFFLNCPPPCKSSLHEARGLIFHLLLYAKHLRTVPSMVTVCRRKEGRNQNWRSHFVHVWRVHLRMAEWKEGKNGSPSEAIVLLSFPVEERPCLCPPWLAKPFYAGFSLTCNRKHHIWQMAFQIILIFSCKTET